MNVLRLSLVLLAISSNLLILEGCCKKKNNGKNKSSKSTPGGGSKPNPNPNPSHVPSSDPRPGSGPGSFTPHGPIHSGPHAASFGTTSPATHGPSSSASHGPVPGPGFSGTHGPVSGPSFSAHHGPFTSSDHGTSASTPTTPVDYSNKTLDDIKLPAEYKQDKIGGFEYRIMSDYYNLPENVAKNKVNEGKIRYYKTEGNYIYHAYIFFYDIFNDSDKYFDLFKLTEHIYYTSYKIDEGAESYDILAQNPEFFFGNN